MNDVIDSDAIYIVAHNVNAAKPSFVYSADNTLCDYYMFHMTDISLIFQLLIPVYDRVRANSVRDDISRNDKSRI